MRTIAFIAIGLAVVTSCATVPPSPPPPMPATADTFEAAFAKVRSGEVTSARAEGYVLEFAGEDGIRVLREQPLPSKQLRPDGEIARELRHALRRLPIAVRVEGGVVTLRGDVGTQYDAVQAIRAALKERGVVAVDARLRYPVNEANR